MRGMYPVFRLAGQALKFRKSEPLDLFDTHVSHHVCWPHDLDVWVELNNGRTLTLYDLGRLVLFQRIGMVKLMRDNGWAGTVAGASIRYRRRVRAFHKIEMRSRVIGWDDKFFYLDQSMWRNGDCTSQVLLRTAVTSKAGIVSPAEVTRAAGMSPDSPDLPGWVQAWIAAEAERPWPPEG